MLYKYIDLTRCGPLGFPCGPSPDLDPDFSLIQSLTSIDFDSLESDDLGLFGCDDGHPIDIVSRRYVRTYLCAAVIG